MLVRAIFHLLRGSRTRPMLLQVRRQCWNKGATIKDANYRCLAASYHTQILAISDFRAERRQRLSPRAAQGNAPYTVVQQQIAAQTGTIQPGATSESSQSLMSMAAEMITTIQHSADGVRSEQQTMESVFQTRSRVLNEHLAEVSRRVVLTTQSGQPNSVWTRGSPCAEG
eukprot:4264405-Amphidinium_carterae.1